MPSSRPASTSVRLSTESLNFIIWPETGRYALTDLRTGVTWDGARSGGFGRVVHGRGRQDVLGRCIARPRGRQLVLLFHPVRSDRSRWLRVTVTPCCGGEAVELEWEAAPGWSVREVHLLDEALSTTDRDGGAVLIPCRLGILVPADSGKAFKERFDSYDYQGCHMLMWGVVKQGAAALISWDSPYVEARISSTLSRPGREGGIRQTLSTSMVLSQRARRLRIHLLGKGDGHTVAKAYRGEARRRGLLPLGEGAASSGSANREKLLGAANVKLWSCLTRRMNEASRRQESVKVNWTFDQAAEIVRHLDEDLQLDRVLFTVGGWIRRGYDNQHPDLLPAAAELGGNEGLARLAGSVKSRGYLFCLHDNYQDIYRDAPSWDEDVIVKTPAGKLTTGGRWAGGRAYLVCSAEGLRLASRPANLPAVREIAGADAYFIDTTTAAPLIECADPNHPTSRGDDLAWKRALCEYGRATFGVFGSECGREWAVGACDFFEGLTGVSGSFYHTWKGHPERHVAVGGVPWPLWELVYRRQVALYGKYGYDLHKAARYVLWHACIGRTLNHHSIPPGLYWKSKDATRFAEEPAPRGGRPDEALYTRAAGGWAEGMHIVDRFLKNTQEILGPLNELTAQRELAEHVFLSADRMVRRSVFGSEGDPVTVIVNMGDEPAEVTVGRGRKVTLGPRGLVVQSSTFAAFVATRWGGLTYDGPAMFTVRSQDGRPISSSHRLRVFHGCGDNRIRLGGRVHRVDREAIVGPN